MRQLKASDSASSLSFRKSDSHEGLERGGVRGTGYGGAERGDLSGRAASPSIDMSPVQTSKAATAPDGSPSRLDGGSVASKDAVPRLTQQLLAVKAGQEGP